MKWKVHIVPQYDFGELIENGISTGKEEWKVMDRININTHLPTVMYSMKGEHLACSSY
jgi:hypothetical protein